jgi:hypothetical protein
MAMQRQVLGNRSLVALATSGSITPATTGIVTITTVTMTTAGTTTTTSSGVITTPATTGTVTESVLSHDDLGTPFAPGARLTVGHTFGDSPHQIEFTYFALGQYDTYAMATDPSATLTPPATGLMSPFTNFGHPPSNTVDYNALVQIQESSNLQNAEFNWRMLLPTPPGMTLNFLMGLRYIGVSEDFDYASQQSLTSATQNAVVNCHTMNTLLGPQIGGLAEFNVAPQTWLSIEGKGAICNNAASRDLDAVITQPTSTSYSQNGTAYVADLSLAIFWRPTSFLTARVGYQALWINGLVLAANNFAPSLEVLENPSLQPPTPLDRTGTVLYHGPYAGLEVSW